MSKEMLINTVQGQECRIALVTDGRLEELYFERASNASHVGNVYKGRIMNVEPGIQAAFVDFGLVKNGFLHISDLRPEFFPEKARKGATETVGRKRAHKDRPPIQDCLKRGQEVVIQLTKEGIGTKGPTLTTYLSIPGRLLVMMPGMTRMGVSRKVEDEEARAKARALLADVKTPPDMGFIVRTAGVDKSKRELQRDLAYLARLWKTLENRAKTVRAPAELYRESDLVIRTLRDIYNTDIDRIICDNRDVADRVLEFLSMVMPRTDHHIDVYTGTGGLFHDIGLDEQIEKIHSRRVELPSGGSLVIDQTEALVAIDVNSGRYRQQKDAEMTALKTNVEAAGEIARQLRLRDLGGVIVIDFIDMRADKNRRAVEKALRDAMKDDRAKGKLLRISSFGIVEMTRQRMRPSLLHNIYATCTRCNGEGLTKSDESLSLQAIRLIQRACSNADVAEITVGAPPPVAERLANTYRQDLVQLEQQTGKHIRITVRTDLPGSDISVSAANARGSDVAWESSPAAGGDTRKLQTTPLSELPDAPKPRPSDEDTGDDANADLTGKQPARQADEHAAPEAKPAKAKKSRRRRGRRRKSKDATAEEPAAEADKAPADTATEETPSGEQPPAKKSRRRRRKKPSARTDDPQTPQGGTSADPEVVLLEPDPEPEPEDAAQKEINAKIAAALFADREPLEPEDAQTPAIDGGGFSPADLLAGEHHRSSEEDDAPDSK